MSLARLSYRLFRVISTTENLSVFLSIATLQKDSRCFTYRRRIWLYSCFWKEPSNRAPSGLTVGFSSIKLWPVPPSWFWEGIGNIWHGRDFSICSSIDHRKSCCWVCFHCLSTKNFILERWASRPEISMELIRQVKTGQDWTILWIYRQNQAQSNSISYRHLIGFLTHT